MQLKDPEPTAADFAAFSARDALNWLFARNQFTLKLGLDTIRALLAHLGHPQQSLEIIHVAGTNGKGSVCGNIAALLQGCGYRRVGLYTSPHLVSFRERIRVDGKPIALEAVRDFIRLHGPQCQEMAATYFEIATAMALDYFRAQACEAVVLETGLGGRLDATNAVLPKVTVITPVDIDHTAQLGPTLPGIFAEKAAILKPGVPMVVAAQAPGLVETLAASAEQVGSPLIRAEDHAIHSINALRFAPGVSGWGQPSSEAAAPRVGFQGVASPSPEAAAPRLGESEAESAASGVSIPAPAADPATPGGLLPASNPASPGGGILGPPASAWSFQGKVRTWTFPATCRPQRHQRDNLVLACLAVEAFAGSRVRNLLDPQTWVTSALPPGRTQFLERSDRLPLCLDGAHNPHGLRALEATLRSAKPGKRWLILFAIMGDKPVTEALEIVTRIPGEIRWVPLWETYPRAFKPDSLKPDSLNPNELQLEKLGTENLGVKNHGLENREPGNHTPENLFPLDHASLLKALQPGSPWDGVLICGSLYLLGEAIALICRDYPELSEFAEWIDDLKD